MRVALLALVATLGVLGTIFAAVRMWRANRSGAPRELVLGYLGLMVVISVVSLLVLRLL
jgi:surface polysaccharide O-acyltransferase-like enzyme